MKVTILCETEDYAELHIDCEQVTITEMQQLKDEHNLRVIAAVRMQHFIAEKIKDIPSDTGGTYCGEHEDVYKEGGGAYYRDISEHSNPYTGILAEYWSDGYEDAKSFYERGEPYEDS